MCWGGICDLRNRCRCLPGYGTKERRVLCRLSDASSYRGPTRPLHDTKQTNTLVIDIIVAMTSCQSSARVSVFK